MHLTLRASIIGAVVLLSSLAHAQEDRATSLEAFLSSKVSVQFKDTDLRDVFQELFHGKASFVISPEVYGRFSGKFNNITIESLMRKVLGPATATYRIEQSVVHIVPKEFGDTNYEPVDNSYAVSLIEVPLDTAVYAVVGAAYKLDPAIKIVPITFHGRFKNWVVAICALADQLRAEVVLKDGLFVIRQKQLTAPSIGNSKGNSTHRA